MSNSPNINNHLKQVKDTLHSLELNNLDTVLGTINKTTLSLDSVLGSNDLYVDDHVLINIKKIKERLALTGTNSIGADATGRKTKIETDRRTIESKLGVSTTTPGTTTGDPAGRQEHGKLTDQIRKYDDILSGSHISSRQKEYEEFEKFSEYFNTAKELNDQKVKINSPLGSRHTIYDFNADFLKSTTPTPPKPKYFLLNKDNNPIDTTTKAIKLQLPIIGGGTQEVVVDGFDFKDGKIDLTSIKFNPPNVDFSQPIELNIKAQYSNIEGTGINISHIKKLNLNVGDGTSGLSNDTERETAYDNINSRLGGHINTQLAYIYDKKYEEKRKEVIFELLKSTNESAFEKLTEKEKNILLEKIANQTKNGYDMDIAEFQDGFKSKMIESGFSGTESEFEKFIVKDFDKKGEDVLKHLLLKNLDNKKITIPSGSDDIARSVIVGEFMNFLTTTGDMDISARHTTLGIIEGNLSAEYLETRLRQDYENKFNKVQREAFEKVLGDNPEFAKLNQAQKDRLYERMQDLGTVANPVRPISLGTDAAGTDVTYPVNEITFAPSTHDYSVMPHGEDYNGFKTWLANQAPKDVINDEEKYRQWLRNGLVASLNDGKTHYESFFEDVLKQFTDDLNVKTTLNKTLLDFINDTNEADHVGFEADLAATLNATEPLTTHTKKRYQRLAFWTRGEPQNYLSFFSGQSHEFKNESITAGGKTFGYTGKLDIHGAQSMSMSLKMKEGREQIYTGGNPVALVRTLLNSPDIEPPHARFHAGLSVVKSVTKIARENGISLRTALTPETLETLPLSIRTTLENGENPMVEIEEENGKLVAKVFNLNLTTRRKENEYKMFDEQDFIATQSVRDLRQGVQGLLALTNQTMNSVYSQYRETRFRSGLRPGLLRKPRYGGLRNGYKKLSFTGESISVGGKSFTLDCKDGLFTFSGGDLKKPVKGRNFGDLLAYNPALRGVELRAIRVANEKMLAMYQEKLKKQERHHNYGVIDEENHRVYIYDKNGNLGYYESNDQTFVQRWRQYTSGHRYGRIADENMPTGFRVMKRGDTVVDSESYENFLRNETVVGSMVRAMSRTHRALIAMDPR